MFTLERPSSNGHATTATVVPAPPPKRRRISWRIIVAALLVVTLIVGGVLFYRARTAGGVTYTTVPVTRQTLVQTVSATGTVNPQNTISVGTQVSGTISEIDVDFNSKVHKGQVLARLDPTQMQAALDSAQAQLAQSEAQAAAAAASANGASSNIGNADAAAQAAAATARAASATAASNQQAIATAQSGVTKAQSALALAQQTVSRDQQLLSQGYIPQSQLDTDQSNLVGAQSAVQQAQVAVQQARTQAVAAQAQAQASQSQAQAQQVATQTARDTASGSGSSAQAAQANVAIQEAAVKQAQTNLAHTIITSPVDGTVVARDVSVGQTVAASLQTPTLFALAQDLSKMEVDLQVGEPDIGSVKTAENVDFTVLAYPTTTFHGVVSQVRKNPTTVNNVVTYTTVVLVSNQDGKLLPGMTANANIGVQTAKDALIVPLAALSYHPTFNGQRTKRTTTGASGTNAAGAAKPSGTGNAASASPWGQTLGGSSGVATAGSTGRVFVEDNGKLTPVPVTVTLVSGTNAAVEPADDLGVGLLPNDKVVIADNSTASARRAPSGSTNPFQPQRAPGGYAGGGGGRGGR